MKNEPKDVQIPLVLIGLGLLISGGLNIAASSGPGLLAVLLAIALGTLFLIVIAFMTAGLLGVSFGELQTAALKLAAVYVFPAAVGGLFPFSFILQLFIWLGLLMWLFELELYQAGVFTLLCLGVNLLAGIAMRSMVA